MNLHHTTETATGTIIGGTLGFIKGVYLNATSMLILNISWSVLAETTLLSGVGALIGLVVTFYGRLLLKKLHKK